MRYIKTKKIKVSRQTLGVLAEMFGCKVGKVYNALAFRTNNEDAEHIRLEAVQNFGGKEVIEIKVVSDYGSTGKGFERGC